MDSYIDTDFIKEKVTFICSIKRCQKNASYKIRITNDQRSLGDFPYKETKEIKAEQNNDEINFETLNGIEFRFNQLQLFTIEIMKKSPYNFDNYMRQTIMSSLVTSEESIYERKVNEKDFNSEKFKIEVKAEKSLKNSENMKFFDSSILNFFKEGGKLKLLFFFDFSGKDSNIDYALSSNIFYNLLVNFYNYCHLYTKSHEVYILKEEKKFDNNSSINNSSYKNSEEDFIIFDRFDKIKDYFIKCLKKEHKENQIFLSPFIGKSMNEIQYNFFNVLIIFIRNLPEDIKIVIDKVKEIKNENKSTNIIIINAGNKFSNDLTNKIKECSNIILIENQDDSQEKLLNITNICLNEIAKNIIDFKQNQTDDNNDNDSYENKEKNNRSINISENYGGSIHSDEEQKEQYNEENSEENIKSIISNNKESKNTNKDFLNASKNEEENIKSLISNNSINNNKENKNMNKVVLKTSENYIKISENPYSNINAQNPYSYMNNIQNPYSNVNNFKNPYSLMNNKSIKESDHESDSEINKNEEIKLSDKNINKEDKKCIESKMVDSKTGTDYSSFNNKIIKSKNFFENND